MTSIHRRVLWVVIALTVWGRHDRAAAPLASGSPEAVQPAASVRLAVVPGWPGPLPHNWTVGPVSGVAVDHLDHIWILQRGELASEAGKVPAPPVIEFDSEGAVVQAWGGPGEGYEWPQLVHGITVDAADRVWISGSGVLDAHILVFTRDGKFIRQIGRSGRNGGSNDIANLGRAAQMRLDPDHREVFVADGEMNLNHRVIVFDSETGAYRRHWGGYGGRPDDSAGRAPFDPDKPAPRQFGTAVHCLRIDRDGLVYVCDRSNNRFQIFRKDGTFVKEVFVAKQTRAAGSLWDLEFSPDERYVYVADGANQKVWILSREEFQVVGSVGEPGQAAGQFATALHGIAVDSKGNLYTAEADRGGRVQKFAPSR